MYAVFVMAYFLLLTCQSTIPSLRWCYMLSDYLRPVDYLMPGRNMRSSQPLGSPLLRSHWTSSATRGTVDIGPPVRDLVWWVTSGQCCLAGFLRFANSRDPWPHVDMYQMVGETMLCSGMRLYGKVAASKIQHWIGRPFSFVGTSLRECNVSKWVGLYTQVQLS